ncbi:DNA-binding protein HU 1 [Kocuria turfanensis]|jgi:DNA-binding protein HU-beta|uniref:DNA-binding protein HU 1 n=3 Tax=Kocuria TaxID=57493 RepID=A0A512IBP8_9MICC|nr:DNA-binding protein HU 1 [Kocuria turfanensis]
MNMAKNRSELVAEVAEKAGTTNAAVNGVLDALFQVFEESVSAGEKITIPGWLAVERTDRAARTGRNPQTGETIEIPAGHGVKLTAGSKLKAAVSKK